jgi:parallel beta-helix repeat protein
MTEPSRAFLVALNRNLLDATALAGAMPANLRSAADVYSTAQITAFLATKEDSITAGTADQVWQGDKTWIAKTGLPISTATQTALDLKLTTTALDSTLAAKPAATTGVASWLGVDSGGDVVKAAPSFVTPEIYDDGVLTDTQIIAAALATGLTVVLEKGKTYTVTDITVPSGSILELNGATLSALATTVNVLEYADNGTSICVRGPGVIDCNSIANYGIFAEGVTAERVEITGVYVLDPLLDGIRLRQASDVDIHSNTIENAGQHGITVTTSVTDFCIDNNKIYAPAGAGVIFSVGKRGSISGNIVHGAGPSGDGITGYAVDNEDVSIVGNIIKDTENHGIHVGGLRIAIANNIINGAASNIGIFLGATDTGSSGGTHVDSTHCTITGNIVNDAFQAGIFLRDSDYCTVSSNVVNSTTNNQIYLETSDKNTVTGNIATAGGIAGYFFSGSKYNVVAGNKSAGNTADGFRFDAVGGVTSDYNIVTGNMSDDDNRGFVEATSNANFNVFTGNSVYSPASTAFVIAGANSILNNVPLFGSATFDPTSLADGAGETTTVTVTGAALGDFATVSFSVALSDVIMTAWVSAADTVSVRFQNESGGVRDISSGTLRARVVKATSG